MRRSRWFLAIVLGLAVAALGASADWALSREGQRGGSRGSGHGAMMGNEPSGGTGAPVRDLADASARAQSFASRLGLRADETMQFRRNYYVKLVDARGNAATEVLVDPRSGAVSVEYGPAMMWNTRYGMHAGRQTGARSGMMHGAARTGAMMSGAGQRGGMMGPQGVPTSPASGGTVSLAQARSIGQRWLDANGPGVRVESGGDSFPGYYTLETLRDGRIEGMLSVNARTGAVWRHTWHGAFVASAA